MMNCSVAAVGLTAWLFSCAVATAQPKESPRPEVQVLRTEDFAVTGTGSDLAWKRATWQKLNRKGEQGLDYTTQFKTLYSPRGIYFLIEGTDRKLTTTIEKDFDNLWLEDVYEVFLWPDERDPLYFEYEISPMGYELPILAPNLDGKFRGWLPWHYGGDRKVKKATAAQGGERKSGATVQGWQAEFCIPYELMVPLRNLPPKSGTKWRANVYRMDYDQKPVTRWDWAPVQNDFHEFNRFGTLVFE